MPEIADGIYIAVISGLVAIILAVGGWLRFRGKDRVETEAQRQAGLSERFDDASELAKYIRDEVERQVEIQVAPIREKLKAVEGESHEMNNAVRARETQLWLWDHGGREGALPMLPKPILERLSLIHLIATEVAPTPKEGTP